MEERRSMGWTLFSCGKHDARRQSVLFRGMKTILIWTIFCPAMHSVSI
jgi:hypothetical protein